MKNSFSEVARRYFQRLTLLFSRTKEVEQVDSQHRNTNNQPTTEYPKDPDINEAYRQVLARREEHQARYPVEELARRMEASGESLRPKK